MKMQSAKKTLQKNNPRLRTLFKNYEISFSPQNNIDTYETLIRSIAHQQLHGKAAETILGRMLFLFNNEFPKPEDLLRLGTDQLRNCGFSNSKVKSIMDIARHQMEGKIPNKIKINSMTNEEIIESLTDIYGVGKWTVEMFLIFNLGRLNVWPVDDFGVRKGYQLFFKLKEFPTAGDLKKVEQKYSPYQTIIALYLWRVADQYKIQKAKESQLKTSAKTKTNIKSKNKAKNQAKAKVKTKAKIKSKVKVKAKPKSKLNLQSKRKSK